MACTRCYFDKIWYKAILRYPNMRNRKLSDDIKDKMMTLGVALYVLREIQKLKKAKKVHFF